MYYIFLDLVLRGKGLRGEINYKEYVLVIRVGYGILLFYS